MYVDWQTVVTAGSVLGALIAIFTVIFKAHEWYLHQNHHDKEIQSLKAEGKIICKALYACLDGLGQVGANGNVTAMKGELAEYLNIEAHK